MAEAAALADWLFVLHEGRLVVEGPPRSVFALHDRLRAWGLATPPLNQLLPTLLLSIEGVGPLLVVKTPAGSAEALGSALDSQEWPEVIGCIAGDDTMLIVTRSERARRGVAVKLRRLSGVTS